MSTPAGIRIANDLERLALMLPVGSGVRYSTITAGTMTAVHETVVRADKSEATSTLFVGSEDEAAAFLRGLAYGMMQGLTRFIGGRRHDA